MKNTQTKGKLRMEVNLESKQEAVALFLTILINSNKQELFEENILENDLEILERMLDDNDIDDSLMSSFDEITQELIDTYQVVKPDVDGFKHSFKKQEDGTYNLIIETLGFFTLETVEPHQEVFVSQEVHSLIAYEGLKEKYNFRFSNDNPDAEVVFEVVKMMQAMADMKDAIIKSNPFGNVSEINVFDGNFLSILAFNKMNTLKIGISSIVSLGIEIDNLDLLFEHLQWLEKNNIDEFSTLEDVANTNDDVNVLMSEIAILHEYNSEALKE